MSEELEDHTTRLTEGPPTGGVPAGPRPGMPERIGRYMVRREIARGGMGVVYEAQDDQLRRRVAVKVIQGVATSPEVVARLQREARTAGALNHPNIIPIHELGTQVAADGSAEHYIVMDFIEGQTLGDLLGSASRAELLEILRQVSDGVGHAHRNGVIHRDLKPPNILVAEGTRPIVTDFGLARDMGDDSELTRTGAAMGTPMYMSPEQVNGQKALIGARTDVWALGVILYQILTGELPFRGSTPQEVFHRVLFADPQLLGRPQVSRELAAVCLKALEKDPSRRYADGGELADELRRWADGEPVLARPPGWTTRLRRRLKRRPILVAVVLVCVTLAATGGLLGLRARRDRLAFEGYAAKARTAFADGRWTAAMGHLERALAIRQDLELRQLAVRCRERLQRSVKHDELQGALDTARQAIEAYVQARYVPESDMAREREKLVATLASLARQLGSPAFREHARGWATLGRGWLAVGDDRAAERALLRADTLGGAGSRVPLMLGQLYLERSMAIMLGERPGQQRQVATRQLAARAAAYLDRSLEGLGSRQLEALAGILRAESRENALRVKQRCELALARFKQAPGTEEFLLHLAWSDRKRPATERIALLTQGLARCPHHAWLLMMRGWMNILLRRPDAALADYDAALKVNPRLYTALVNRAYVLEDRGRLKQALADCERAIALEPRRIEAYVCRGQVAVRGGRYEQAAADGEKAIALQREDALGWHLRGMARLKQERYEAALADLDRAVRLEPKSTRMLHDRAAARAGVKDFAGALTDLAEAIRLSPRAAYLYNTRAQFLFQQGQLARAMADLTEAIRLQPKVALHRRLRAVMNERTGRFTQAAEDYSALIRLEPSAEAYRSRGVMRLSLGRFAGAEKDLRESLRLEPRSAASLSYLGVLCHKLARYDEAIACYDRAMKISPGYGEPYENKAETLAKKGDLAGAVAVMTRLLARQPRHLGALERRAKLQARLGRWKEAVEDFRRRRDLSPGNWAANFNLGMALVRAGRPSEAIEPLRRALRHAPASKRAKVQALLDKARQR